MTALADELARATEFQPDALAEYQENRTIAAWIQESHRIAMDFAYAADRVEFVSADAVDAGTIAATAVPTVSANYREEARKIARHRLALAALRLMDVLPREW